MPLNIPVEIWYKIAEYIPADPFTYLSLSRVSRSSNAAFLSDRVWRELDLDGSVTEISHKFVERMANSDPLIQAIVREGWKWIGQSGIRSSFDALAIGIDESQNSPEGLVPLSFNNEQRYYSHTLAGFAHVKLIIALKLLDDMEQRHGFTDPLCHNELVVLSSINNADPIFMALLCRSNRGGQYLTHTILRSNRQFVLQILRTTGQFLPDLSLSSNPEFAREAIKIDPKSFMWLHPLHDDSEIARFAIATEPFLLSEVSERLQDDEDLVQLAVSLNGHTLEYASARLKGDMEVVRIALEQDGQAVEYIDEALMENREIFRLAIENSAFLYQVWDEIPCSDREIALFAVKHNVCNMAFITPELQNDPEILHTACENDFNELLGVLGYS